MRMLWEQWEASGGDVQEPHRVDETRAGSRPNMVFAARYN
jgi:hypothetical protein